MLLCNYTSEKEERERDKGGLLNEPMKGGKRRKKGFEI
jgi:hypothetical protein